MPISTRLPEERSSIRAGADRRGVHGLIWAKPELPVLLIVAIATALRAQGTVNSDVSWQLWIARHLYLGAHLYRDIIETNPPLWFWMAIPVDRIAAVLGVRPDAALIVTIGGLVMVSIVATGRLLTGIAPGRRAMLLAYAGAMLFAMPWMPVGQREQLVLIGALPYAALIAARRSNHAVSPGLAALIGTGAALGFALKHYFLIVPALLELWLLIGRGRNWRLLRPEIVAMAVVGALYACAVMIWARDFLTVVLPMLRLAYGTTGAPGIWYLFQPGVIVGLLLLAFIALHQRLLARDQAPLATALVIAAAGFAAVYFIQGKGWPYHAIPFLGCASVALAALLAETAKPPVLLRVVAPALLSLPFAVAIREGLDDPMPTQDLLRAVSGLRPGDPVGFLAEDPSLAWSVTLQHDLRYVSRYNGYWMLRAIDRNEAQREPDPRLTRLDRLIVRQTATDFRCIPPRRIIIARPQPGTWNENMVDILPFFLRDPDFAELFAHYRPLGRRTSLDVYDLAVRITPLPASACRPGV